MKLKGKLHLGFAVAAAGYMVGIFLLSSLPGQAPTGIALPGSALLGKVLHVPLFAGLASCLLLAVSGGQWVRGLLWPQYLVIAAVAMGYAAFDEWHQGTVPGRFASPADVLLNCGGVGGLLLVHWLGPGRREGLVSRRTASGGSPAPTVNGGKRAVPPRPPADVLRPTR